MKTLLVLALCMALLMGCGPASSDGPMLITDEDFTIIYNSGTHDIYRFIDRQMGVVCWVYLGFKKGGISCVPLALTGG